MRKLLVGGVGHVSALWLGLDVKDKSSFDLPPELNQNCLHCVISGPVGEAGELGGVDLYTSQHFCSVIYVLPGNNVF